MAWVEGSLSIYHFAHTLKRSIYGVVAHDVTNHVITGSGVQLATSYNGSLCDRRVFQAVRVG